MILMKLIIICSVNISYYIFGNAVSSLDSSGANEATKFIDEKLIDTLAQNPGVIRQVGWMEFLFLKNLG